MLPMLDVESLKLIQETAAKAAGIDVKNRFCVRETLPDKTKWAFIDKDGMAELRDVSQPARNHKLLSVQEVVGFALHAIQNTGLSAKPIVWIGPERISVTLDDRRLFGDRAVYEFRQTPEWSLLKKLSDHCDGMDQKSFLKLLRIQLAESFADENQRLQLVRGLRKVRGQQQSAIGQGSGSFDATLTADGEAEWPEHVDLDLRVIDDLALTIRYPVRCVLDVEPSPPRFLLTPLAAHLARAETSARELVSDVIRHSLKDSTIPVFLGQPE